MPIDMQRPKKIPVGRLPPPDVQRLEVEALDDGTFIVTCFERDGDEGMGMGKPTKSTFQSAASMAAYVGSKMGGGTQTEGAVAGQVRNAVRPAAARREGVIGESKRRPTRPAGEEVAPAYAETQTDIGTE